MSTYQKQRYSFEDDAIHFRGSSHFFFPVGEKGLTGWVGHWIDMAIVLLHEILWEVLGVHLAMTPRLVFYLCPHA